MAAHKPTVAVYKFSSCDGCQLSLLNMEDELLDLANAVDIAFFLEASRATRPGPYDIALVEGSVTTPHEIERIQEIREQSKVLIALGTCATAGGIQALRNYADADVYAETIYSHPEYLHYLKTSKPISGYVKVDLELPGCPVNKAQVIEVIVALREQPKTQSAHAFSLSGMQAARHGLRPRRQGHSVPRPCHGYGLRRAVSCKRPRLLWLLWPNAGGEHQFADRHPYQIGAASR